VFVRARTSRVETKDLEPYLHYIYE